jgi:predicted ATP-grasp superfamily ATP-dependent carboligase
LNTEAPPAPITTGVIDKNARESIHVSLCSFKGHVYLDVRIHAQTDDRSIPTKSGVTLRPDMIAEFRNILMRAESEMKNRGLISVAANAG